MDQDTLLNLLEQNECRGTLVPISRLDEVKREILDLHRKRMLDEGFYQEWMPRHLNYEFPRSMLKPKSILLVASPAPQRKAVFHLDGDSFEFIIPPTYSIRNTVAGRLTRILKAGDGGSRPRFIRARPPLKLTAVRSGLAFYGRNNVTYVKEFGSFHRLTAFYSNVEASETDWYEKRSLPRCSKCKACIKACPTNAIVEERFLIKAERCLSFMNERTNEHRFPSWVKPEWHNSIIGCMICQRVCPYNRDLIDRVEVGPEFSETETEYLLKGKYSGKRAASIERKLKAFGLDLTTFPRNLEALLNGRTPG